MAEKNQVKPHTPSVNPAPHDVESAIVQSDEPRKKNINKIIALIVILIVFQTAAYAVLRLTVLRPKAPNVKISSVTVENLSTNRTIPAFDMKLIAEVSVKNKNWGKYEFDSSIMTFSYKGVTVGEAQIPSRKTKLRGTRRVNITANLSSKRLSGNSDLKSDLNSGILVLNSYTKLRGQVTLMFILKKNKSGEMTCTMAINTKSSAIEELNCN